MQLHGLLLSPGSGMVATPRANETAREPEHNLEHGPLALVHEELAQLID